MDACSSFNTKGEVDILCLVLSGIKNNSKIGISTKLIILLNKGDNIDSDIVLGEMVKQSRDIISTSIYEHCPGLKYKITSASCEKMFVNQIIAKNFHNLNNVDIAIINKFGKGICGDIQWRKYNRHEKHLTIINMIKKSKNGNFWCSNRSKFADLVFILSKELSKDKSIFILNK